MRDEATAELLWAPSAERDRESSFTRYREWLARERGLGFSGYSDCWEWSTTEIEEFWGSLWDFFQVQASRPYTAVLEERRMPGARWFPGAELNYAEHCFRHADASRPALFFHSEIRPPTALGWEDLGVQVASTASTLREMGVRRGDRVVAYLPNIPETVVAFLACASLGAIWSSCSPDFGTQSVTERFQQIEPKVLFAVDGYVYAGKALDRRDAIAELRRALPTL